MSFDSGFNSSSKATFSKELDYNNSENVNAMKTFLQNAGNLIKYGGRSLQSIFNEADTDKDNALNRAEVASILEQWNMNSIYDVDTVFNNLDVDHDNLISETEIENYGTGIGVELNSEDSLIATLLKIAKRGSGTDLGNTISEGLPSDASESSSGQKQFGI